MSEIVFGAATVVGVAFFVWLTIDVRKWLKEDAEEQ